MTVHRTHQDIRTIREPLNKAPDVSGKMINEANDYRGSVIVLWFRDDRTKAELIDRLEANQEKVFLSKVRAQANSSYPGLKIAVFAHNLRKNIQNKISARFCNDRAALPVFLLDDSPSSTDFADEIWIVGKDGEVEEKMVLGKFF